VEIQLHHPDDHAAAQPPRDLRRRGPGGTLLPPSLRPEIRAKIAAGEFSLADLDGQDFCVVAETAAVLRCDPRTVRARLEDGTIPGTRLGSDWRIPVAWLRLQAGAAAA
jgi:excisionase family DNA binding protein